MPGARSAPPLGFITFVVPNRSRSSQVVTALSGTSWSIMLQASTEFDGHRHGLERMKFTRRLPMVVGGGALLVVSGLVAAWASFPHLFGEPQAFQLLVCASVVFAPLMLLVGGVAGLANPISGCIHLTVGLGVLFAFPICPLLHFRRARLLGVLGLIGWAICQAYVVLAWNSL